MPSCANGPTELGVQRLDRVRRVDDPPHAFGVGEERHDVLPVALPALTRASQILVTSAAVEETVPDVREW